ncbi:MAG: hypothetical protein V4735_06190 [Pseudomonadota bacterium]
MKKLLALTALLLTTGCATITADSDQLITITTDPAGASCIISNSAQSYTLEQTPGSVTVERAYEPLDVLCTNAAGQAGRTSLTAKTRGRAYGNILLLGIPALVDASTGDGYVYEPSELAITLAQ